MKGDGGNKLNVAAPLVGTYRYLTYSIHKESYEAM